MQPKTTPASLPRFMTALVWLSLLAIPALGNEEPRPTPKPGTLGAYAQHITLDRAALNTSGPLVLTNSEVTSVADGATITLGLVHPAAVAEPATSNPTEEAERERWTRTHRKQRQVIAALEQRRALVEIDVAVLDDQRPTPKLLARLEQARAKLRHIERQIAHEKEILARIVRQARQHGAQPDWFR